MTENEEPQVSESQIAVHWREEEYIYPPEAFVKQANANDPAIFDRFSKDNFPDCFTEYADLLDWDKRLGHRPGQQHPAVLEVVHRRPANASYNCVDRHVPGSGNKAALICGARARVGRPSAHITYRDLYHRVNEFAALLQDFCGLKAGDRVTLHMPMVPELPVTMLACARLGIVHSQVFGGFSGNACRDQDRRLGQPGADHDGRLLPQRRPRRPQGQGRRGGRRGATTRARRSTRCWCGGGTRASTRRRPPWSRAGTSSWTRSPVSTGASSWTRCPCLPRRRCSSCTPPAPPAAPRAPSTAPAGTCPTSPGTSRYYQDIHPDDTYWCMADIGWITGHSYIVYGPLALGTTSVIYEGAPNYPDAGRPWRIAEQARREHLPHLADRHPDAAQGRPGRARRSTTTTSST